jgi:hypothetical protein
MRPEDERKKENETEYENDRKRKDGTEVDNLVRGGGKDKE